MTEQDVRIAIAKNIKAALVDLYVGQSVNRDMEVTVQDHWVLTFDTARSAAALRALEGADMGKIHGWMVGLSSLRKQNEVIGNEVENLFKVNRGCDPDSIKPQIKRRKVFATFKIWAFIETDLGSPDEETISNSENWLSKELEAVSLWFSNNLTLGLIPLDGFVGHSELQFEQIAIFDFGESIANGAKGTLNAAWYEFL